MYLSKSLCWQGQTRQMVGVVPGDTVMHARPVGRGYARLQPTGDDRWQETAPIPAHEFHYSSLENLPADSIYAYTVTRGHGIDGMTVISNTTCSLLTCIAGGRASRAGSPRF